MEETKIIATLKALEKEYEEDTEGAHIHADSFHMRLIKEYMDLRGLSHLTKKIQEQSGGWYA